MASLVCDGAAVKDVVHSVDDLGVLNPDSFADTGIVLCESVLILRLYRMMLTHMVAVKNGIAVLALDLGTVVQRDHPLFPRGLSGCVGNQFSHEILEALDVHN